MSDRDHDIFTERGITPPWEGGDVARAQGFERYEGADWRERLERLTRIDSRYGDGHPDPEDAYLDARAKLLDKMLGPGSAAAAEYDGPVYDDRFLEITAFAPIRERRSFKTQARLHFDHTERAPDDVLAALAELDPAAVARRSWQGWLTSALAVDGWAMPRHAVLPADPQFGRDPLTQVRPDAAVKLRKGPAKYVYTPGRTAKRLGTNPLARELPEWDDPDALFVVVLEGTLKMCSVVEAGYPAIDAGSVTLWGGGVDLGDDDSSQFVSELERFASRHLVGRPVAVVCDSDWNTNDDVLRQTRKVANVLGRAGARAIACAPPEPHTGEKLGVDDWLGLHPKRQRRAAVLELVYHEKVGDAEFTVDHPTLWGLRADGAKTVVDLLRHLGEMASPNGIVPYAEATLARELGRSKDAIRRARGHAEERNLIEEVRAAARRRWDSGALTMEPALLQLAPEALPKRRTGTLGEWLERSSSRRD